MQTRVLTSLSGRLASRRVLVVLLALSVLPLVLLSLATVRIASDAIRSQADARLRASADASATAIAGQLAGLRDAAGLHAQQPVLRRALRLRDAEELGDRLDDLRATRSGVDRAFAVDARGRLMANSPPMPEFHGTDFSGRDWFRGAGASGRPYVSGVFRNLVDSSRVIAAAAPVQGEGGRRLGYIGVAFRVDALQRFVETFARRQGVRLVVMDQDGVTVAAPGRAFADPLDAAAEIRATGWTVEAQMPAATAHAPVDRLRRTVLAITAGLVLVLMGALAVVLSVLRERDSSERELRASEGRFRSAFDSALVGMCLTGADGRIKSANDVLAEMLDRPLDELLGAHFSSFAHPDDVGKDVERVRRTLAGEIGGWRTDKRYLTARGDVIWTELSTSLVRDADGEAAYFVTQMVDITERKREEAEADRLKNELFALISHELRTPLTSVIGYTDLLLDEEEAADLSPDQRESLEIIHRNARRLHRLVGDLLFAAQIERGELHLVPGRADLGQIVHDSVEAARPLARASGIALSLDAEMVPLCAGDADRLGQVLDNLVGNACKFTPAGGHVDVRLRREGERAVIEVADDGRGIALDEQRRLFERFYRASSAGEVQGAGLGLSIVRAIVEGHGGTVEVASARGTGTTFTVRIPLVPVGVPTTHT
jgi:PAS domain S-box-containing protein